tara:strand:- start:2525 stop:3241 length:717 start_codon:yes stop_codon:yes gene_type:complete
MSKQLKFKLKKTLKNAEFVHADLEYHEELNDEAKKLFAEEVNSVLNSLPPKERKRLKKIMEEKAKKDLENLRRSEERRMQKELLEEEPKPGDLVTTDHTVEEEPEETVSEDISNKSGLLKKLFHKIAELTHPDKINVNETSPEEAKRRESIFKKAMQAYDQLNWYVLYTIALDLDLDIEDPTDEQVEWIEEDIRATLSAIAQISATIPWSWYVGNPMTKQLAIKAYFSQVYGYNLGSQ